MSNKYIWLYLLFQLYTIITSTTATPITLETNGSGSDEPTTDTIAHETSPTTTPITLETSGSGSDDDVVYETTRAFKGNKQIDRDNYIIAIAVGVPFGIMLVVSLIWVVYRPTNAIETRPLSGYANY